MAQNNGIGDFKIPADSMPVTGLITKQDIPINYCSSMDPNKTYVLFAPFIYRMKFRWMFRARYEIGQRKVK